MAGVQTFTCANASPTADSGDAVRYRAKYLLGLSHRPLPCLGCT
jgi:hypothetical protein